MKTGLRIFGHPLHAMVTALPIALFAVAPFWNFIGLWRGEPVWWAISFWDVALGLAAAAVAALSGILDFLGIKNNDKAAETAMYHMMLMLSSTACFAVALAFQKGPSRPQPERLVGVLALQVIGLILLGVGGWFGGHLVFHHGIGRDSDVD